MNPYREAAKNMMKMVGNSGILESVDRLRQAKKPKPPTPGEIAEKVLSGEEVEGEAPLAAPDPADAARKVLEEAKAAPETAQPDDDEDFLNPIDRLYAKRTKRRSVEIGKIAKHPFQRKK